MSDWDWSFGPEVTATTVIIGTAITTGAAVVGWCVGQYTAREAKKARENAEIEVALTSRVFSKDKEYSQARVRRTIGTMTAVMDELLITVNPLRDLLGTEKPGTLNRDFPGQDSPPKEFEQVKKNILPYRSRGN